MEVTHITSHYSYNGENSQGRVRLLREIRKGKSTKTLQMRYKRRNTHYTGKTYQKSSR